MTNPFPQWTRQCSECDCLLTTETRRTRCSECEKRRVARVARGGRSSLSWPRRLST